MSEVVRFFMGWHSSASRKSFIAPGLATAEAACLDGGNHAGRGSLFLEVDDPEIGRGAAFPASADDQVLHEGLEVGLAVADADRLLVWYGQHRRLGTVGTQIAGMLERGLAEEYMHA
ncbi:hypothetical protein LP419_23470 [Massilia sp. H-1]|nr:hypothetical protein LP419_23470 [Massilia sp. H-1]